MTAASAGAFPHAIKGLDSLRFIAALVVALGHGLAPALPETWDQDPVLRLAAGAYGSLFNGPAAVVIFFLISGLVIHYPYTAGGTLHAPAFLVRRLTRVALPLLAAMSVAAFLGEEMQEALRWILWSLYCELIYYALYPVLLPAIRRWGALAFVTAAFALSIGLMAVSGAKPYHWLYPIWLLWLVALPPWALGCLLAERLRAGLARAPGGTIWLWRVAILACAATAMAAFFHAPVSIGHPVLLTPFALLAFFWLEREIGHFQSHRPWAALEWCGRWSYSLYLTHMFVIILAPLPPGALGWALRVASVLAVALVFYAVAERPSHLFARGLSRRIAVR